MEVSLHERTRVFGFERNVRTLKINNYTKWTDYLLNYKQDVRDFFDQILLYKHHKRELTRAWEHYPWTFDFEVDSHKQSPENRRNLIIINHFNIFKS